MQIYEASGKKWPVSSVKFSSIKCSDGGRGGDSYCNDINDDNDDDQVADHHNDGDCKMFGKK